MSETLAPPFGWCRTCGYHCGVAPTGRVYWHHQRRVRMEDGKPVEYSTGQRCPGTGQPADRSRPW